MENIIMTGYQNRFFTNLQDALSCDYNVHVCDFVDSAIRQGIRELNPDLVLYLKPLEGDTDSIKDLFESFSDMPFVIICDEEDNSLRKCASELITPLQKPVKVDQLNEVMEELICQSNIVKSKKKVLAVDDDGMELRNIKDILGDDYRLYFATSGARALEMLQENDYDVILLDYEMPQMSGLEVFKKMNANPDIKKTPVIFLTGVSDRKRIVKAIEQHPAGYILKPIDTELLISKIAECTETWN